MKDTDRIEEFKRSSVRNVVICSFKSGFQFKKYSKEQVSFKDLIYAYSRFQVFVKKFR